MRASPADYKSALQLRKACGAVYAVGGMVVATGLVMKSISAP